MLQGGMEMGKIPANEVRPVTTLGYGKEGIIRVIMGGNALISRLAGLGISLNIRIRLHHASGGLVIVQVAETRVALGHRQADGRESGDRGPDGEDPPAASLGADKNLADRP
jgi:Fe2+ transport system protein FeoA